MRISNGSRRGTRDLWGENAYQQWQPKDTERKIAELERQLQLSDCDLMHKHRTEIDDVAERQYLAQKEVRSAQENSLWHQKNLEEICAGEQRLDEISEPSKLKKQIADELPNLKSQKRGLTQADIEQLPRRQLTPSPAVGETGEERNIVDRIDAEDQAGPQQSKNERTTSVGETDEQQLASSLDPANTPPTKRARKASQP
ncbi:unnamed protein product [Amoebophrya sp. A25]|nr:unnamed protein product [Amoebophrya sp. A25]|eukprot:GSA25T00011070001.1